MIDLVAQFKQLNTRHIRASLFNELASATPPDRTLRRLVEQHYLARLQRRLVGGSHGGSSQHVYQLGRAGWTLLDKPGAFWAPRAINLHSLGIADCFVAFKQAEQRDELVLLEFITEPECHASVGPVQLTPDARFEVGDRARGVRIAYWLELDRGTEHRSVIAEKCSRYWKALHNWQQEVFPTVLFVTPDLQRAQQLAQTAHGGPVGSQALFKVAILGDLVATCIGTDGSEEGVREVVDVVDR
ncbi:replication-relaxation family protein [Actinophytocola algeriensis]|uniref:Protein involved in plasmid replication-relaxation n=1 Tax=Actinophytocola algeriensis TaxID=1768010 RepID=A0A7W7QBP4_9PSEU|nr:replication-relaxation family protein [Actinophytocola algeriensis]MBB4910597.1 hypothetical protein [Actinophytocola algeriensis]MBE1480415.1 hypothetical protein [Actinophytocola algeriensis]